MIEIENIKWPARFSSRPFLVRRGAIYALLLWAQFFSTAQDRTMGLVTYSDNATDGYILLSNNEWTYLIDGCGFIVNSWESAYKTGHGYYLFSDGRLLRAGRKEGTFDAGGLGGVVEVFDWEGNLIWSYTLANSELHQHHDLEILPNGNFLLIAWELKSDAEATAAGRAYEGNVWSEKVIEIEILPNNAANVVWEWSVWDHLIQDHDASKLNFGVVSEHPEKLDINFIGDGQSTSGNWMHMNSISYNAELDQIVIGSRNFSEFYVIDHSTTTQEAASGTGGKYGKGGDILFRYGNPQTYDQGTSNDQRLFGQHHVDWTPEGSTWAGGFSLFNNDYMSGIQSEVLIIENPADASGVYSYSSESLFGEVNVLRSVTFPGLYSDILSGVQLLPDDNLLVLEGRSGHIRQVDSSDETVWEYIYPVNRNGGRGIQGGTPRFNMLFRAEYYPSDFDGFAGKDLSPLEPIELSPEVSLCNDVLTVEKSESQVSVYAGANNLLKVSSQLNRLVTAPIVSIDGKLIESLTIHPGTQRLQHSMKPGIYFLRIRDSSIRFLVR